MKENIETTRLENGLTIITEKMPDVRSATLGFWLRKGSRHEPNELNGIFHFIEHAVFKGTPNRSSLEIAVESDRLGGNFNAFTSHEETAFFLKVVDKNIPKAFDLLSDVVTNPIFDEKELKRERGVIFEEMKMVEDAPEELLSELFLDKFFPNHPLGMPIEGTRKTLKNFNAEITAKFHAENFTPENIIIVAAGNVEHKQIVELSNNLFGKAKRKEPSAKSQAQSPSLSAPIFLKKKQNLEQAHLIIAAPWLEARSEKRYAASLLTSILGDGNSSRLWQNIREKRGLAYSLGASANSFDDCGLFTIYAGTSPAHLGKVIDLSIAEIRKIKREGVSADELELAKEQTVSAILLGLESTSFRAENLAGNEITYGRQISLEETLENFENVRAEELQELANEFFQTENISLAALGNLNGLKVKRERLDVS